MRNSRNEDAMPNVSIIIPIYNSEKMIRQCVDSILCQTYPSFELLLINDGSTDNCPQICDEYAEKDSRITVIHKANQGVSAARNDGIVAARGTFITFVDSDDYVSNDYLAVLVEDAKKDFDFVCATKTNVYGDRYLPDPKPAFELDLTQEIGPFYYNKLAGYTSPYMKLFKRAIIMEHNIRFRPDIHYGEDTAFVYKYLCFCKQIKQLSASVYFYRVYEGSAARKFQKGISECLAYRQAQFEMFIHKLKFADPVNNVIVEGFAYNGFRLLTRNVLYGSIESAIEEINCGQSKFMPYIDRLYKRIGQKDDVSIGGIPSTFYKEIAFIANANSAKKIYLYTARNVRKRKVVLMIKAAIKKIIKRS